MTDKLQTPSAERLDAVKKHVDEYGANLGKLFFTVVGVLGVFANAARVLEASPLVAVAVFGGLALLAFWGVYRLAAWRGMTREYRQLLAGEISIHELGPELAAVVSPSQPDSSQTDSTAGQPLASTWTHQEAVRTLERAEQRMLAIYQLRDESSSYEEFNDAFAQYETTSHEYLETTYELLDEVLQQGSEEQREAARVLSLELQELEETLFGAGGIPNW